jgi:hypothetical protein
MKTRVFFDKTIEEWPIYECRHDDLLFRKPGVIVLLGMVLLLGLLQSEFMDVQ